MPLYKITDEKRTTRKLIVVTDLQELLRSGSSKLGISSDYCNAVLELDGTPVEEDEVLLSLSKDDTIMILPMDHVWKSPQETNNAVTLTTPAATPATPTSPPTATQPNETMPATELEKGAQFSSDDILNRITSEPLPSFSSVILDNRNKIDIIWRPLTTELATYYFHKYPNIGQSIQYRAICEKVYKEFPCIGLAGSLHPWTTFSKTVAQKIRHMRHYELMKNTQSKVYSKKRRASDFVVVDPCVQTTDDEKHLIELAVECQKTKRDKKHIQMLINSTAGVYNQILENYPGGQLRPILKKFPCYKEMEFIIYKLSIKLGLEKIEKISLRFEKILSAIETITEKAVEDGDPWRFLYAVNYIENELNRTGSESIINVIQEYDECSIESYLSTKENKPLKLVVFGKPGGKLEGSFLCGDTISIDNGVEGGVTAGVFKLFAAYYIFDINYPKPFSNIMGFLQSVAFEEPYKPMTNKFKFLLKKIENKMN